MHEHHLIPQAKQSEPSFVGDESRGIQTQGSGFKIVTNNFVKQSWKKTEEDVYYYCIL